MPIASENKDVSVESRAPLRDLDTILKDWKKRSGSDLSLQDEASLIRSLSEELFGDYEPFAELKPFWERLSEWIQNVEGDEDQQTLFRIVPWLLFFGQEEMKTLYRAAYTGPIARWIMTQADLKLMDPELRTRFDAAVNETLFGSLAGMDLGSFLRLNGVQRQDLRPEFRGLAYLGDDSKLQSYLRKNGYRRIVLIDDFVGTGSQMTEAIPVLTKLDNISVLISPLISASKGCETGEAIQRSSASRIAFDPYFRIPAAATVCPNAADGEPEVFTRIRGVIARTRKRLRAKAGAEFGYGNLGLLVLTYLNCPNNLPPIFHRFVKPSQTKLGWSPLFPRVAR